MGIRILIVGASIAGLTLAHRLVADGIEPIVVERASQLRVGGNGVDLRGDAMRIAESMGILTGARSAAADVLGIKFVDGEGREVARVSTVEPGSLEVMRGDLVHLLADVTPVEIRFGDSPERIEQDGSGVTVSFTTGRTERFDAVFGADGMHSTVRRLAFGAEASYLRLRGHHFAFADADAQLGENRWVTMHNLPGKMVGVYRSGNHEQAKAYFIYRTPFVSSGRPDPAEHRRMLSAAFEEVSSWHTGELLASALASDDLYVDALAQVRMRSWSNGRVALVGDAAWCGSPASGAGAELALVGAHVLACELRRANGDLVRAFARYEGLLRPLVSARQRISANVRLMVPATSFGIAVRNTFARSPLPLALARVGGAITPRERSVLEPRLLEGGAA
ncbi:FAD-dependent monooxygenase [Humibacter sp. RRB41]|uniref:FAD-dependent monooxygenase n=1 Tax=Humibacter sp. RRB41 TaxID=2919946 RepID=UPI001FAA0B63|nr:FAD-dependent monooxygenase [Humibacter sp. RRB41]